MVLSLNNVQYSFSKFGLVFLAAFAWNFQERVLGSYNVYLVLTIFQEVSTQCYIVFSSPLLFQLSAVSFSSAQIGDYVITTKTEILSIHGHQSTFVKIRNPYYFPSATFGGLRRSQCRSSGLVELCDVGHP